MPGNGKTYRPGNRENVRWYKGHEKRSKSGQPENLRNEDILRYIKDIEQNCRLEVNSGDEDYAGTKRSSNCSVRFSGTGAGSSKKTRSRVTYERNRNAPTLEKRIKRSFGRNTVDACAYCCPSQRSRFNGDHETAVQENSKKELSAFAKSAHRYPRLSSKRDFRRYRKPSPRFYGWYSRKGRKTWPADTEMTSLEIIEDRSRRAVPDSRVDSTGIVGRRSARARTFKSLRGRFNDSGCANIRSSFAPNEINPYRIRERKGDTRELNEDRDISDFAKRQPLNRNAIDKLAARSYPAVSKNDAYEGRYASDYRYSAGRFELPVFRGASSRSGGLTARLTQSSPVSRRLATSGRGPVGFTNEAVPSLNASRSVTKTLIDRRYRRTREPGYKNDTDQGSRMLNVSGERDSSYYRKSDHSRESGKLCKVIRTRENKRRMLGCCCEDIERGETADCSRYCRCPETSPTRLNYQTGISKGADYGKRVEALRETPSKSVRSRLDDASGFDLSTEADPRMEAATFDESGLSDHDGASNYAYEIESEEPHADYWTRQTREIPRDYGKLTGISGRYPPGERSSFDTRAPRRLASADSSGLGHDAPESACECEEAYRDGPTCLAGFCTCVGNEDVSEDGADPSRDKPVRCCCSSARPRDQEDPLKKLESFCERVKAVNRDVIRKSAASTCCNSSCNRTRTRRYRPDDSDGERDRFEGNARTTIRTAPRSRGWERSTDFAPRPRLEKPKRRRCGGRNLERTLIYPPRGASGPPLTLYKRSSNINCRVKGDANSGFRYDVTYVQNFVSPTWMPDLSPRVPSRQINEECGCSAEHG